VGDDRKFNVEKAQISNQGQHIRTGHYSTMLLYSGSILNIWAFHILLAD
jgi:hypothetical protein